MNSLLSGLILFGSFAMRTPNDTSIPKDDYEAVGCTCALGPVVGNLSSKELQDMGVLADLDISVLQMLDSPLGFNGYAQELKWLTTDETRLKHISKIISQLSNDGNTLVLIDRIKTGEILTEINSDWVFVSGGMKVKDRQKEYFPLSLQEDHLLQLDRGI